MVPIKIIYVYKDIKGQEWHVYKDSLPKKRGQYSWWNLECPSNNLAKRVNSKEEAILFIKSIKQ